MAKVKLKGRKRKYIRVEKPKKIFEEMTENHVDVLENIEFVIVSTWREDRRIDDKEVAVALKSLIKEEAAKDEIAGRIIKAIENTRLIRADVSDEIWIKGLKVVLESVYTHSEAEEGDRFYLEFAEMFIP
jgi:hypothetical protein